MGNDTYEGWKRRSFFRRHRIILIIGALVITAIGGSYAYTYAPVVGPIARKESAITASDEEITAQLDYKLDAYLSRLAPYLQKAGFSTNDFKDESKPAFRWTNVRSELNGQFTSVRSRTAERKDPSNEISIRASISAETITPSEIEAKKKRGLNASSHLSITVKGKVYCKTIAEIIRIAASKPVEQEAAMKFDRSINDPQFNQKLAYACDAYGPFPPPSSPSFGVRIEGLRMPSGTRWMVSVLNSNDVKIWGTSPSK